MGQFPNPATMFKPGNKHRFQPGQSGNPAGKPRGRVQFEEEFSRALLAAGSPDEAAQLLWKAARAGEAWALMHICQRFAPQTQSLRLVHEVENGGFDYSRLSDEQIEQLQGILETAGALEIESGEGPAPSA